MSESDFNKKPSNATIRNIIAQVTAEIDARLKATNLYLRLGIIASVVLAVVVIGIGFYFMRNTINDMYQTYIKNTEKIIIAKSDIEIANSWERLPVQQRKERLRERYFEIVRYYTNAVPEDQRMSTEQIMDTFNKIWACIQRIPSINFFLPVAYIKVASNFNPVYNSEYKRGIAAMYRKTAESAANLPIVKHDPIFQIDYKGLKSLNNPIESVTLLIARINDLMTTFNNREDWVLLALFTNEYNVIKKYWDGGKGTIPDKIYEQGQLADALKFYQNFKNWQIPAIE